MRYLARASILSLAFVIAIGITLAVSIYQSSPPLYHHRDGTTTHTEPARGDDVHASHQEESSQFFEASGPAPRPIEPTDFFTREEIQAMEPEELSGAMRSSLLSPTFEELSALPGFLGGGFESASSDVIEVMWHGTLSAEALLSISAANQRGMDVRVVFAPVTEDDLALILDDMVSHLESHGAIFTGASLSVVPPAIIIYIDPDTDSRIVSQLHTYVGDLATLHRIDVTVVLRGVPESVNYTSRR